MKFYGMNHRDFYFETLAKCKRDDSYHRALVYLLGLTPETRANFGKLFDLEEDLIIPEGLSGGWQTSGTHRICRLAFNLWNDYMDEQCPELFSPAALFCSEFAPYFVCALRLRFPEYMYDE